MIGLMHTGCCGMWEVRELSSCRTPQEALGGIALQLRDGFIDRPTKTRRFKPFVVFTSVRDVVNTDHASGRRDDYGAAFADFIVQNNLGTVVRSEEKISWTGNRLCVSVWTVNYPEVWKFLKMEVQ